MASQVQIPFEGVILQEHSAPISCPTPNFAKGSTVYFHYLIGPVVRAWGNRLRWARPGLSFSLQRAQARSNVVTATLFAREHALKGKILRHDHAPW